MKNELFLMRIGQNYGNLCPMQDLIAYSLVALAVIYFSRHIYLQAVHKKKPGCGDCGGGGK